MFKLSGRLIVRTGSYVSSRARELYQSAFLPFGKETSGSTVGLYENPIQKIRLLERYLVVKEGEAHSKSNHGMAVISP